MEKKWPIVLFCVVLVIVFAVPILFSHYDIFIDDVDCVTDISIITPNSNSAELRIKYQFPSGGYSVRLVPENEGEYIGDGMIAYDGSLGKYRMIVEFGDIEPSTALASKFTAGGTVVIKDQPIEIRAKIAQPADHGFVLYLGFDKPISIDESQGGKLNPIGGTVKIPISIENE